MPNSPIHTELAEFQDEVIALLDSGDFFDIEGQYDPVEFYASIPKKAKEEYIAASEKKNSRVWGILKAFLIGGAITAGFMQVRKDYPKQEKQYFAKAEAQPKKYPKPKSAKDYADEYMREHGGELIKNMTRSDQKRLVGFIWANASRNERPLAREIKNQPHIQSILDTGKHRTATIIRTERHRAINYGATAHAKDIGAKTKTRSEKLDIRCRPTHRALRDITVLIDEPYPNGEMYPGQHSINCRGSQLFDFDTSRLTKNVKQVYDERLGLAEKLYKSDARKVAERTAPRKVAPMAEPREVAPEKIEPRIIALGIDQKYIDETLRNYHSMPDALKKNCNEIVLMPKASAKDAELSKQYGRSVHTEAAYDHAEKRMMGYPDNRGRQRAIAPDFMAHELAHAVDKGHSKSDLWHKAAAKEGFSSQYATDFYYLNEKAKNALKEDFADSVKSYVTDRENFKQKFPSKYEYLETNVFGGKQ